MKRRLKKLVGYVNDNVKIWVIQNEIRDCVDENEMTMEGENEEDEKFEIHPNKDVIKPLCTEDLNGKNEDAYATSIEVHIIPNENVDILPLPIKRTRKDYGKSIPMSIREDVVDVQSFNVLQSLVADYVFNKSL
uniref:Uncharacterized protein n=1 Tax=Vitis vinifera TaxID=29760 RepID=A5BPG2_VITVI|nr:hypothetical protein VITISV_038788 [Vitis vinifera]